MLYQQASGSTGLQEEFQSQDKGNPEKEENDYITESESTLQSYCSREKLPTLETTNYQTSSRQVDSWLSRKEESPSSQELSNINPQLLQCLISQVQSQPCQWNKACPEYEIGHKKKLVWINIASILRINGKSIQKSVGCIRYLA